MKDVFLRTKGNLKQSEYQEMVTRFKESPAGDESTKPDRKLVRKTPTVLTVKQHLEKIKFLFDTFLVRLNNLGVWTTLSF